MTLRTSALVAGLLGLVLLAVGLIADSRRPDADVVASHAIDTPIAVLGPEVVALESLQRVAVDGEGQILAHTARPIDAQAWLATREATVVVGLADWETVTVAAYVPVEPSPSASPTPSGSPSPGASASPSPSPSPSPSASPSPSPSASPSPGAEEDAPVDTSSTDHWRETWRGTDRLAVTVLAIPAGETFIVQSADGGPLGTIHLYSERDPNDAWITPLIWWGALLVVVGLVGLVFTLIDVRPWQRKGEEWASGRSGRGEPKEGSRRARRMAGASVPVAELTEAADAVDGRDGDKGGKR